MKNVIEIGGHKAVVSYDPEIGMFRGDFIDLAGGADFYATSVEALHSEGQASLKVYLEVCAERGIEPFRSFSGRFNVRLNPQVHEAAVTAAAAENKSLNEWVAQVLADAAKAS
ncbi:type II toxin-antitoxin system HicB family antitoxin [Pelagibacterium mangrovi]|uniref:type II toxin-antitoxin system HicB family antitoxin n=1 Tax=Pelagibacterium mangrovi TaxID=3119828 RepID=UPI002FC6DBC9